MAPKVMENLTEKCRYFILSNVIPEEQAIETEAVSLRADGDPRDDGDAVVGKMVMNNGRLAYGGPGTPHAGGQHEARFVDENQVGAQPRGVFFTCFQVVSFHFWIAASLRSRARRSGFCGLHPSVCMSRPAWVK